MESEQYSRYIMCMGIVIAILNTRKHVIANLKIIKN